MASLLILISILTPIITGFTSPIKEFVNPKYHAIIPIIVGLVLGPVAFPLVTGLSVMQMLWGGLLSGLAAGGFYSVQNIRNK